MWKAETERRRGRSGGGLKSLGLAVLLLVCVARVTVAGNKDTRPVQRDGLSQRHISPSDTKQHAHGSHRSRLHVSREQRSKSNPDHLRNTQPYNRRSRTKPGSKTNRRGPPNCAMNAHSGQDKNRTHTLKDVHDLLCQFYTSWSTWRPCNRRCFQQRVRRCRVVEQCGKSKLKERRPCRIQQGRCSPHPRQAIRDLVGKRGRTRNGGTQWTEWGSCTRSCKQRRRRRCTAHEKCSSSTIIETRQCSVPGSRCQKLVSSVTEANTQTRTPMTTPFLTAPPDLEMSTETVRVPQTSSNTKPRPQRKKEKDQNNRRDKLEDMEDMDDVLKSSQSDCGRRPPATRGSYRVVGGQIAQRLSWPWQVAIMTRWEEQYCGGTLIAPQWVLTAAHCVRKRTRRRRIIVRAGEHDLEEFEGSEDDVKPDQDFPHPDFDYDTITNDIALVHLDTPVDERSEPGYACLPEPGFTPDRHSLCYILGWGKRRNTHLFGAEVLHEVQVPLVTPKRCQRVFDYHINKTQVCAGYRKGGKDACSGDSGGPLLCPKTVDGITRWYLTGITSYGEGCGRRGKYGIYTRVTSYRDWILDTIGQH